MFTPFDTMEKGDGHPTDRRADTARQHRACLCRHSAAKKNKPCRILHFFHNFSA